MQSAKNVQTGDKELILCEGTGTSSDKPTSVRVRSIHKWDRTLRRLLLLKVSAWFISNGWHSTSAQKIIQNNLQNSRKCQVCQVLHGETIRWWRDWQQLGTSASCLGRWKAYLITTWASVKNKIKKPIYGPQKCNFPWQKPSCILEIQLF